MHRPNNSERFAFERMARTNNRDSLRKVLMIGSVSYVPYSRDCLSCGPGTSARKDHRGAVPAGSDGRESCEPRLCRFGDGTPNCSSQNRSRKRNPKGIWAKQQFASHRTPSVALAWCFEDEATNWTEEFLER